MRMDDINVYCINDNKLVYKVDSVEFFNGHNYAIVHLKLTCGWDYINPDYTNEQGYVNANRFIDDVQYDSFTYYFIEESLKDSMNENGYEITSKPHINQ